jgi:NTF2 fold immunity protein
MKLLRPTLTILLILSAPVAWSAEKHSYTPKEGYVPTADTAVKIAEAVWLPIYGESIQKKKPFTARLENGVWIVEGTLPKDTMGGVPIIEISKKDGKILRVSHGK